MRSYKFEQLIMMLVQAVLQPFTVITPQGEERKVSTEHKIYMSSGLKLNFSWLLT